MLLKKDPSADKWFRNLIRDADKHQNNLWQNNVRWRCEILTSAEQTQELTSL